VPSGHDASLPVGPVGERLLLEREGPRARRPDYTDPGIAVIRSNPLPHDVGDQLATIARALDRFPDVVFAYLFGSLGSGCPGPLSDVDIAIYLEAGADFGSRRLDVVGALTRHLGTDEVDVVVLNSAPIALAGRVLVQRRVILDRLPFVRHRYESLTTREFLDFRHFEHQLLERRFARGRQGPAAPEAR
jgi:predicted nucleotidyltransferase